MPRDRRRATLEAGPKLALKDMPMKAMTNFRGRWRYGSGLELELLCQMRQDHGWLRLSFNDREQHFSLEGLPCHFGGVKWFIRCPRTGRRVRTLWKPPGATFFGSRHVWGRSVAYSSQFYDRCGRAWAAKRHLVGILGGGDGPDDYELPEKPPRMHWATYDRLVARYEAAEAILDDEILRAAAWLMRRYPGALS